MIGLTQAFKYVSKVHSDLERDPWTDDAGRHQALSEHVKDILMERQLHCCLARIRWKIERYAKYGVPEHDRSYVRFLRLSEDARTSLLELEEGEQP